MNRSGSLFVSGLGLFQPLFTRAMGIKDRIKIWQDAQLEKFSSSFGESNYQRTATLLEEIDQDLSMYQRDDGVYRWVRAVMVLILFVWLSWWKGFEGFVAAALFSIFVIVAGNAMKSFFCSIAIYPVGMNGFNRAQEYLAKYSRSGPEAIKIKRAYWMYKWRNFLYSAETGRWSWRFFLLLAIIGFVGYWSPILGGAMLAAISSLFFVMLNDLGHLPIALYLGSSSLDSHRTLSKIRKISGVKWVSLLSETVNIEQADGNDAASTISAWELMYRANPWSIRQDETDDWMGVVQDFIQACAIIVVRPDTGDAVREEIRVLQRSNDLQRVIILDTVEFDLHSLPDSLKPCVLPEQKAIELLRLTSSSPRSFRQMIGERFC